MTLVNPIFLHTDNYLGPKTLLTYLNQGINKANTLKHIFY